MLCCVVWCGVVLCGVVWCCVVWCGVVLCRVVSCRVVSCCERLNVIPEHHHAKLDGADGAIHVWHRRRPPKPIHSIDDSLEVLD